jgi:hypothetical protein
MAAYMKMSVIWVVTPRSLVGVCRHFRGTYCLHYQGDHAAHGAVVFFIQILTYAVFKNYETF